MSTTPYQMSKTRVAMDDGRTLNYYDFAPRGEQPPFWEIHQNAAQENPAPGPRVMPSPPEMRWNPTLGEWTVFAPSRMSRVQLPSKDSCPLCPGVLELPLPYQVAIFENRSPSMSFVPPEVAFDSDENALIRRREPARGRCDIVVYSQEHEAKMALMSVDDILCLIEAWRDRYGELIALDEVQYVSIFENKGREAGMTLDHPHGQIYAFPFLPPLLKAQWEATRRAADDGQDLWSQIIERELQDEKRIIAQSEGFVAGVPYYARYPFEVHIWARRKGVSSLLQMNGRERGELASLLQMIVRRYENLWPNSTIDFPSLMLMQQMAKLDGAEDFRFHIEFLPLQRSEEKLKYRASIESGTGTFLNDALPETQAQMIQEAAPHELNAPAIRFED